MLMDKRKLETRLGVAIVLCCLLLCSTVILVLVVGFQNNKIKTLEQKCSASATSVDSYRDLLLSNQQQPIK